MAFVKFTEVGKQFQPRAQISAGGVISFNQAARKKFGLDAWSHCVMYLDPESHRIAFELVNDENLEGAGRLRHIRHEGVDVNARPFLDHFKLRIRRPLLFRVTRDLETDWLTLALDEAEPVDDPVAGQTAPSPLQENETEEADIAVQDAAENTLPLAASAPSPSRPAVVPLPTRSGGKSAAPTRGVKAMLSELLQD